MFKIFCYLLVKRKRANVQVNSPKSLETSEIKSVTKYVKKKTKSFLLFSAVFYLFLYFLILVFKVFVVFRNILLLFFSFLDSSSFQKFLLLNIIPSFDIPFLAIYIFISLDPFGKSETTQISGCLHKPKLLRIIDFLPLAKLLELLALNHSLSKRMDTFVCQLLKLSHVLVALQLAWVRTSTQLSWITRFRALGFLWHSLKWAAGSVVSFNIHQGLKC